MLEENELPGRAAALIFRNVAGRKHSLQVSRLQVTRADLNSPKMLVVDKKRLSGLSTRRGPTGRNQCGTGHLGHGVYLV
jgi:hypothetical protein